MAMLTGMKIYVITYRFTEKILYENLYISSGNRTCNMNSFADDGPLFVCLFIVFP